MGDNELDVDDKALNVIFDLGNLPHLSYIYFSHRNSFVCDLRWNGLI